MNEFDKMTKALIEAEDEVKSIANMGELAQMSAEMVRERVRDRGKGVSRRGAFEHTLAPLKPSTIKARSKKKLHPKTSPGRSNLTETGQMLDAMKGKGIRKGFGDIVLDPQRTGGGITNDEVAFYVSGKRPFIDLSNEEVAKLEEITAEKVANILEKKLSKIT